MKNGSEKTKISIGRHGGLNGDGFLATGKWRTFLYETSPKKPTDINRNRFEIKDSMKLAEHS